MFIAFIVLFVVILGIGVGLPRWFEWRRSLFNRVSTEEDTGHV
jgi:hypothetical protein